MVRYLILPQYLQYLDPLSNTSTGKGDEDRRTSHDRQMEDRHPSSLSAMPVSDSGPPHCVLTQETTPPPSHPHRSATGSYDAVTAYRGVLASQTDPGLIDTGRAGSDVTGRRGGGASDVTPTSLAGTH